MHKDAVVLFGAPGVGKTTIAKELSRVGYFYYEGDQDLLPETIALNKNNQALTPQLREAQNELIINRIDALSRSHYQFVAAYDFMWDRHRQKLHKQNPSIRWIYLTLKKEHLVARVNRPGHILTPQFALHIYDLFESPTIPHQVVDASQSVTQIAEQIINKGIE
jgi:gluconate kinase